ncbi:MAG: hypothetical protein AAF616_03365 [Bacteroidota bacterium]
MKKYLLIILVLLLACIGYLIYSKWVKDSNLSAWSFIPADAAAVFELELLKDYQTVSGYPIWKNLGKTPGISSIDHSISFLDSINGKGGFSTIFKDAPTLISIHKTASEGFDFLFVLDVQNISQNTFVGATLGRLKKAGYKFKSRNYKGYKISEVSNGQEIFASIFYKNYFLASFTPYLLEDAIRTIDGEQASFDQQQANGLETEQAGVIKLHTRFQELTLLLKGISEEASLPFQYGKYTLNVDSTQFAASGITEPGGSWLTTHQKAPASFDMVEVVPENTSHLLHIASTDLNDWKIRQMDWIAVHQPLVKEIQDSLRKTYDFRAEQVLDLIDEEIGILQVESGALSEERRLCILETKNIDAALDFFNELTGRIVRSRGDTIYSETYSENEIRYLPIRNFPQTFLGDIAGDFAQCFYINHRNYLIFSNNLQELKSVIASIQEEETWGKSLGVNAFLEEVNKTANLSLYVNIPRSLGLIKNGLKASWSEHLEANIGSYQRFEFAAFQFSFLDGSYFSNFTFSQPDQASTTASTVSPEAGLQFASKLLSKPYLLKTHAYRGFDILLQDSTNAIYYLDPEQNTLWTAELEARIVSQVYPIDFYKNGKIQYAFATTGQVHIWDRTGQSIPGYPKQLDSGPIMHFGVIDYDLSRNYRFAVTDDSGKTFLTDKELNPLEGWNPKTFKREAIQPLAHQRLGRRDIMLSIQEDGIINMTNRRAENMPGFPFDTGHDLSNGYFLKASNGLSNSTVTVLSESGELVEISLEGNVIQKNQLLKTSANARFRLIQDVKGKSFLIARKQENQYDILDDTGNLLFTKNYFTENELIIQYYQFGAGRDLIVFTDPTSQALYIYNKTGALLTGNPLKSAHEVSILYSTVNREFKVYTTTGSNLELYTFKY